jgi:glycolate oxidase FAD binding subunit
MRPFGEVGTIDDLVSRGLWRAVRDVTPFAASRTGADRPLWRISTAPTKGAEVAHLIGGAVEAEVLYDWAGGLVWILIARADDATAALVRRAVKACGGHATLLRAPAAMRVVADVFEPPEVALAALMKRVKDSFDPKGVLNPGRMWPGCDPMQTSFLAQLADPQVAESEKFCAPACIAASAPRPARPMCCSATSSTHRAGAST